MTIEALTTKERIKDRLQITADSFDDLLDSLILAVSSRIGRMCNRRFMQATYTEELYDGADPYGSRRTALILRNAPVATVSAFEYMAGLKSEPDWTPFYDNDWTLEAPLGVIHYPYGLPRGKQNIRVTYTAGYTAYSLGIQSYWIFNITPDGDVDGTNRIFTLPENASQVIVYADGVRIAADSYAFTADTDTITFNTGEQPQSTISIDYLPSGAAPGNDDTDLPLDLVEITEEAVTRLFKRRDSEGRSSESFDQSSVTWNANIFTDENLDVIRSFRRASLL